MYIIKSLNELQVGDKVILVHPGTEEIIIDEVEEVDKEENCFVVKNHGFNVEMPLIAVLNQK